MYRTWKLSLSFLQQEKAEQTENRLLFLDSSENGGHRTNSFLENWKNRWI